MEINKPSTTANPSGFGMPACGHAISTTTTGLSATSAVRDRQAAVTGDMGLAVPAYFGGRRAWRPPTS
jgi:hypothetical protein